MLSPNTSVLNAKIRLVLSQVPPNCMVLVESSTDRLVALVNHPESVLLNSKVFPIVKMYVKAGNEEDAEDELLRYCKGLFMEQGLGS